MIKIRNILNIFRFGELNPSNEKIGLYYGRKICRETNSLFIHIPKAAGISFQYGLYGRESSGHIQIKSFIAYIGEIKIKNVFKFTIVRDPYERLISAYLYLKKGGRLAKNDLEYQKILDPYQDFEEFVLNFFQTEQYREIEHFIPQSDWLIDSMGNLRMDYIGYFENLEQDFEIIKTHIFGKSSLKILPKKNITNVINDITYSSEMIKIVNSIYQRDFELLNYDMR